MTSTKPFKTLIVAFGISLLAYLLSLGLVLWFFSVGPKPIPRWVLDAYAPALVLAEYLGFYSVYLKWCDGGR